MDESKKIKRAGQGKNKNDLAAFLNDPDSKEKTRDAGIVMRTYTLKKEYWMHLKRLSSDLTFKCGDKVNVSELVNEALELLFEKYGVRIDHETHGNS